MEPQTVRPQTKQRPDTEVLLKALDWLFARPEALEIRRKAQAQAESPHQGKASA